MYIQASSEWLKSVLWPRLPGLVCVAVNHMRCLLPVSRVLSLESFIKDTISGILALSELEVQLGTCKIRLGYVLHHDLTD